MFESGSISIPDNQFLKEELWSPRFEAKGRRIEVEDKRKMRRHLGSSRSPNHADSLLLTFHEPDSIYRRRRAVSDRESTPARKPLGWMAA